MSVFDNGKARMLRRGWPIHGLVGPNGGGKTLCMIYDTLPSLDMGRYVLSTVRLLDFRDRRPCDAPLCPCDKADPDRHFAAHPFWIPWTSWDQLLEAEHCDVLADEITGIASGREWSSLPGPVMNMLVQLRRRDICFRWTAPAWALADSTLKRCTQAVTVCRGHFPKQLSDGSRLWNQKRMFRWVTYDALLLEDFEAGKRDKLTKLGFGLHWGPGSEAFDAYDTYEPVSTIGRTSAVGTCLVCEGTRRRHECRCPDYVGGKPSRRGSRRSDVNDDNISVAPAGTGALEPLPLVKASNGSELNGTRYLS